MKLNINKIVKITPENKHDVFTYNQYSIVKKGDKTIVYASLGNKEIGLSKPRTMQATVDLAVHEFKRAVSPSDPSRAHLTHIYRSHYKEDQSYDDELCVFVKAVGYSTPDKAVQTSLL